MVKYFKYVFFYNLDLIYCTYLCIKYGIIDLITVCYSIKNNNYTLNLYILSVQYYHYHLLQK